MTMVIVILITLYAYYAYILYTSKRLRCLAGACASTGTPLWSHAPARVRCRDLVLVVRPDRMKCCEFPT